MSQYGTSGNDNLIESGDYQVVGQYLFGYEGKDKLTIQVANSDDTYSLEISGNLINDYSMGDASGGQLAIKATGTADYQDILIDGNSFHGGPGNNKFMIDASQKSKMGYELDVVGNSLLSGDGDDQFNIKLSTSSAVGYGISGSYGSDEAIFAENTIKAGDGNNRVSIKVTAKGGTSFDNYYDPATVGESSIYGNTITAGSGNDRFDLTGNAKQRAVIDYNSIQGGDGDNAFNLKAQGTGGVDFHTNYDEGDNRLEGDGRIRYNSLDSGIGNDRFTLNATAKDYSDFSRNTIDAGDGNNSVKISARSSGGTQVYESQRSLDGDAYAGYNRIFSGDGNDKIEFSGASKEHTSFIYNSVYAGEGDNTFKAKLSTSGGVEDNSGDTRLEGDSNFESNQLIFGEGKDKIDISVVGKEQVNVKYNSISGGEGSGDSLKISITSKGGNELVGGVKEIEGDVDFFRNTIQDFEPDSKVDIKLKAKDSLDFSDNYFSDVETNAFKLSLQGETVEVLDNDFDSGYIASDAKIMIKAKGELNIEDNDFAADNLDLNISGKGVADIDGNLFYGGFFDDDMILKVKVGDGSTFTNNTLETYDGNITLDLNTGLGAGEIQEFFENNFVEGSNGFAGYDSDTLTIKNKGQMIDFTLIGQDQVEFLDTLALGKKSSLILSGQDVYDMTDTSTRTLFLETKGSEVDLGSGWSDVVDTEAGFDLLHHAGTGAYVHVQTGTALSYTM